ILTAGTASVYAANPNPSASTTGGYNFSNPLSFLINPTPQLVSVSPATIPIGTSQTLAVTIANYIPGITRVAWGNAGFLNLSGATTQNGNTVVSASVPASLTGTPGRVALSVVNGDAANPNGTLYPVSCSPNQFVTVVSGLTITTATLPNGTVGVSYPATTVQATGGTAPYVFSATGLPPGLTLNTSLSGTVAVLSGTPTTANTYNVQVTVTDSSSVKQTTTQSYTVVIN